MRRPARGMGAATSPTRFVAWDAIYLDAGVVSVRSTLVTTQARPGWAYSEPKTAKGWRTVAIDPATVAQLRAHPVGKPERIRLGPPCDDRGLVFCLEDGTELHPKTVSWHSTKRADRRRQPFMTLK